MACSDLKGPWKTLHLRCNEPVNCTINNNPDTFRKLMVWQNGKPAPEIFHKIYMMLAAQWGLLAAPQHLGRQTDVVNPTVFRCQFERSSSSELGCQIAESCGAHCNLAWCLPCPAAPTAAEKQGTFWCWVPESLMAHCDPAGWLSSLAALTEL